MGLTVAEKLIKSHLVSGEMVKGTEIGIKIDQTLTQDATGTMAYLEFEAMGVPRVKTERSVAYIDHNTLQSGFENADDHRYIQSVCEKHGIYFSRAGNGICHQVHLERFDKPGKTLLGSDSHTPTAGGMGMLAIGAGGMDVAAAMGGGAYFITCPKIIGVKLEGKLQPFVSAKDIILKVLQILSVKGGVNAVIEYFGDGIKTLSVPERATICNMGAELGATSSVFPADETTRAFLKAQGREEDFSELKADEDAVYDRVIEINLDELEPLVACPHSPDAVKSVRELEGMPIDQVCIGSCTNSSLFDMLKVAKILEGRTVASNVSLSISPGSKQVLTMLSKLGALEKILLSGARLLECACGPCIGMGFSPNSKGISLRTFNRNFEGRSGTKDASVYLVSPETAAASAIMGCFTDPRDLAKQTDINVFMPNSFDVDDRGILPPAEEKDMDKVEVLRGPNIKPFPEAFVTKETEEGEALLKVGDNITTDHIMPAGAKVLPYRSNIPKISTFCFTRCDESFPARAEEKQGGFIIGGANYGQGSSREHAALAPLYLKIKAVITISFARIHKSNLVNAGILPLNFKDEKDYERISLGDKLSLTGIRTAVENGGDIMLKNETTGESFALDCQLTERQRKIILAGGLLNFAKEN